MRNLSINDCGTAHESKLLEIYEQILEAEKLKSGKEPTAIEKNKIEMQVAEAYQTILTNLKDGASISQALNLLEKRVSTNQISITEISKVAIDVVSEVHEDKKYSVSSDNIEQTAVEVGVAVEMAENLVEIEAELDLGEVPEELNKFDDVKIAEKFEETNRRAEDGDENAVLAKGLMDYALQYINITKTQKNIGNQAMILALIKDLSELNDPAALDIAQKLSEVYELDVVAIDENGKQVVDIAKIEEMYKKRMMQINPDKADEVISVVKNKREYLIERGKNAPEDYKSVLENNERQSKKTTFYRKYNKFIKEGAFDKADALVQKYPDLAREIFQDNVRSLEQAQQSGKIKYSTHLQGMNNSLSQSILKLSSKEQSISAAKVEMGTFVAGVSADTKLIHPKVDDEREL